MRRCLTLLIVLTTTAGMLISSPVLQAQADEGTITGTVKDTTDAAVAGATVKLINDGTGLLLTETTGNNGVYTFSPVKIGGYSLEVQAPGFATARREKLFLNVSERLGVDVSLKVGAVTDTVSLSAKDAPLLQTEDASVGQVISNRELQNTPLNGRNYVYLAQLTAGVQESNNYYTGNKGGFVVNGTRNEQSNFILDGVDNNSGSPDLLNGANYAVKPPPDALEEFKVQTGNTSAEFGHSAGAIVNAALRSGTNQIHGGLWEYFRNDVLNAQDHFASSKPEFRQNQFGGMLGGPIVRDKLFIFGDYEGNRIIYGSPQTVTVPTLRMRSGDFSELLSSDLTGGATKALYVPGTAGTQPLSCNGTQNLYCANQLGGAGQQLALKLLNLLPAPNSAVTGQTYSNYSAVVKNSDITNQFDVRTDWNIRTQDLAYARFSLSKEPRLLPSIFGSIGSNDFNTGDEKNDGRNFILSETHSFSNTLVNELRFGYNWLHVQRTQFDSSSNVSANLGLGGVPYGNITNNGGTPTFNVSGAGPYGFGSSQYQPSIEYSNTYQILDNVSKVVRSHSLKAGVSFTSYRFSLLQPPQSRGTYSYSGAFTQDPNNVGSTGYAVADFVADFQDNAALSNPSNIEDVRWAYSAYVQDDWKVDSKLTVNLGLRYEFTPPQFEHHDHQANFVVNSARTAASLILPNSQKSVPLPPGILGGVLDPDGVGVTYTGNRKLVDQQTTNFAPRLGVSYRLTPQTVFRAGYGIYYGGYEAVGGYYNLGFNAPFAFDATFNRPGCSPPPGICNSDGISVATGFTNALNVGLSNFVTTTTFRGAAAFKSPYNQQWNFAVQTALRNTTTVSLTYVGNHTNNSPSIVDSNEIGHPLTIPESQINNPLGVNYYRPLPHVSFAPVVNYIGYSNYDGLNATMEGRYGTAFNYVANYTWSHALDLNSPPLGDLLQGDQGIRNPFFLPKGYDYGDASIDVRHRVTFNGQYELPLGKGQRYFNSPGVADVFLGGWMTALVFRAQTGNLSPVSATNGPTNGAGNAIPYVVANPYKPGGTPDPTIGQDPSVCTTPTHALNHWFNPCAFRNPAPAASDSDIQAWGPRGKSLIRGPGYNRVDMSIFKSFPIWREGTLIQFRTDVFNVLNTPAYFQPSTNLGGATNISSSRFSGLQPDARVFQFALKFLF